MSSKLISNIASSQTSATGLFIKFKVRKGNYEQKIIYFRVVFAFDCKHKSPKPDAERLAYDGKYTARSSGGNG